MHQAVLDSRALAASGPMVPSPLQQRLFTLWASCFVAASAFGYLGSVCYVHGHQYITGADQIAWLIILVSATASSIAGFAFSPLAGSLLFHVVPDTVQAVQIMLVASIALQAYSVWKLRSNISARTLAPYFAGGSLAVLPGVYLLLNTPTHVYLTSLGVFLIAYGAYMLLRRPIRLKSNSLCGRVAVGAVGGITGATAAFPGAFVTIWCGAQGWDKERQRAIYQPYILGMQLLTLIALSGLAQGPTLQIDLAVYILPAVVGAYIGLRIFEKLSTGQFNKVVSVFLLLSGIAMSVKAL